MREITKLYQKTSASTTSTTPLVELKDRAQLIEQYLLRAKELGHNSPPIPNQFIKIEDKDKEILIIPQGASEFQQIYHSKTTLYLIKWIGTVTVVLIVHNKCYDIVKTIIYLSMN